jgi:hypothetical protein
VEAEEKNRGSMYAGAQQHICENVYCIHPSLVTNWRKPEVLAKIKELATSKRKKDRKGMYCCNTHVTPM